MVERERYQLVISLGEGPEGQRLREVLDRAAERQAKPVSVWARDVLLAGAGDSKSEAPVDPIVDVTISGEMSSVDLRAIGLMQGGGWTNKVRAMVGGHMVDLVVSRPDEVFALWKRVHRWGLA